MIIEKISDLKGLTATQMEIIESYCENFGGIEISETDILVQLFSWHEEISYYWIKKFGDNFRDLTISFSVDSANDTTMYITLLKNEKEVNKLNKTFHLTETNEPFNAYAVPYALAVMLEEKGFKGKCMAFYATKYMDGKQLMEPKVFYSSDHNETSKIHQVIIDTPTPCWSEAFDWLKKTHNIFVWVGSEENQIFDEKTNKWVRVEEETSVVYKLNGRGRSTRSGCSTQQLHELALKEALEMI